MKMILVMASDYGCVSDEFELSILQLLANRRRGFGRAVAMTTNEITRRIYISVDSDSMRVFTAKHSYLAENWNFSRLKTCNREGIECRKEEKHEKDVITFNAIKWFWTNFRFIFFLPSELHWMERRLESRLHCYKIQKWIEWADAFNQMMMVRAWQNTLPLNSLYFVCGCGSRTIQSTIPTYRRTIIFY